jgi:hypothetical protein
MAGNLKGSNVAPNRSLALQAIRARWKNSSLTNLGDANRSVQIIC